MPALTETKPTLAEVAYHHVERLLVTLELTPGSSFSESDLAAHLGMGRTPLREALQRLSSDGLVSAVPRRGMIVQDIRLDDMLAIVEARRPLEEIVVAGAAGNGDPGPRAALAAAAADLESAYHSNDATDFMAADHSADLAIDALATNRFAVRAVRPLRTHCRRFWYRYRHENDLGRSGVLHLEMVHAILDGDFDAATDRSNRLLRYLDAFTRSRMTGPS